MAPPKAPRRAPFKVRVLPERSTGASELGEGLGAIVIADTTSAWHAVALQHA
jgi:hypothetical protein